LQSHKQATIALSSTESKYITNVKEFIWLEQLLKDINFQQQGASIFYYDTQSCIAQAKNPKIHEHSKHISLHYHFSREKVERQKIQIEYVSTELMWVDLLTKSLPKEKHLVCCF
jgi:hypothetical protein